MNRPRLVRLLRIGTSAVCLVVCILLIVLWVRSYHSADIVHFRLSNTHALAFGTVQGGVTVFRTPYPRGFMKGSLRFTSEVVGERVNDYWAECSHLFSGLLGVGIIRQPTFYVFTSPHWLVLTLIAISAVLPWANHKLRFSLRTLLIATTLLAVLLGLIVYMAG